MFYYCYYTLCKVNLKGYVGSHKSLNKKDIKYYGSGYLLKRAIEKYGIENFINIPLKYYDTLLEARLGEEYYINLFETINPNGYNISPKGGHNLPYCISEETKEKISKSHKGKKLSIEHRNKISEANKNRITTKETKEKISKKLKGRKFSTDWKNKISKSKTGIESPQKGKTNWFKHTEETKHQISESLLGENNPFFGKTHSKESKQKISNSRKGIIFSEEHRNKISKANKGRISPNKGNKMSDSSKLSISKKLKGRVISEEHKNKIRNSKIGKPRPTKICKYCGKEMAVGNFERYHNENCKLK